MLTLEIYRKNVYGKELIYVKNERQATRIECLTGKKTLSPKQCGALAGLGFTLIQSLPPVEEKSSI